ncbi:MAG: acyltransferase [Lacunisphaera sp.]|nr:acyltransferase [Lacunisphaera sp.]
MSIVFQRPGRYGLISHLRGTAALAVTLFHSFGAYENQAVWAPLEPVRQLAGHGWLGVHIFFVLSGYCLAEKMSALALRGRGAGDFLLDRFWRIVPPYWLTLIGLVLLGVLAASFNHLGWRSALPPDWQAVAGDVLLLHPALGTPGLLLVSWTLACEAGFYLIVAGLLFLWPRVGGFGGALLVGTILMLACVLPGVAGRNLVLTYWPEFWLGLAAYAALAARRRGTGLALLTGSAALVAWSPGGALGEIHFAAVATAVLLVALHPLDGRLTALPALRWLGTMGVWSYSLYLVHVPLLSRAQNLAGRWVPPDSAAFLAVWLASLALALVGAWAFYRCVEGPLERWRHRRGAPSPSTA